MPSDIRSFFGGKRADTAAEKAKPQESHKKARARARKVVDDDDDDDDDDVVITKTSTPQKQQQQQQQQKKKQQEEESKVLQETTADDFFGKGRKPKRSEAAVRPKTRGKATAAGEESATTTTPKKAGKAEPNGTDSARSSARKTKKATSYVELGEDDFPDHDLDDDDDFPLLPKRRESGKEKQKTIKEEDEDEFEPDGDVDMKDTHDDDDFVVPDDVEEIVEDKPAKKTPLKATKKRKSEELEELEDDDDDFLEIEEAKPAAKKRATPAKKPTAATSKKQKKEEPQDSADMKAIFDSIPTIKAPSPPPKPDDADGAKPKFQFGGQHANSAVPAGALDFSSLPQGADNCLAGLTFVFTGQLQQLGREQGQSLVKQYGGKVTTAPSKKTSYVVLGDDAGPKKLETIKTYGLKVINEEGLFELIRRLPENGGDSAAAEKNAEKKRKEEEKIREAAEEMEREENAKAKAKPQMPSPAESPLKGKGGTSQTTTTTSSARSTTTKGKEPAVAGPDTRLWTTRYAPQQIAQICGNKAQVERLQRWLRAFPKNQRTKFKLPGPDASGTFRAVMIHGPPGIGKTTAAHLVAKLEGYDVVESNASDARSKKLVETGLKGVLGTTSLMGYFSSSATDNNAVDASKKKLVLIMDEVDGMSAGDRGGVGALAAVAKKTQIPMILICNERKQPKMKPFDFVTFDLPFRRPTVDQIRSRIMTIAYREDLRIPGNVVNALIEGSGADIRQVVNMISTAKLDAKSLQNEGAGGMSFEQGKDMSKAWEKHIILKPWDMVAKILGGGLFNPAAKSSLNDKQELYFNDHEFAPLMLQENYLGTNPARTNQYNDNPRMKKLAQLELVSRAADAISDGDLVDRMIHGSQQHWSLMPTHAMFSFVRPASFVHGSMAGHQTRFTAWLGKNSNQGKLGRILKEIQGHMRLRISGDRFEVRESYLPVLFERLVRGLQREGKEAVEGIIGVMDEYFLTKEDWDGIAELGVGRDDVEGVKIESQAKAAFTRTYNQRSHPLPFMKASQVVAPKRAPAKEKPDLEEALEESEEEEGLEDAAAAEAKEESSEEADLTKDKYVKVPKKGKTKKNAAAGGGGSGAGSSKGGAGAGGRKRKKKDAESEGDEEDDEEEEEEVKPKKKGKAKAKAKK